MRVKSFTSRSMIGKISSEEIIVRLPLVGVSRWSSLLHENAESARTQASAAGKTLEVLTIFIFFLTLFDPQRDKPINAIQHQHHTKHDPEFFRHMQLFRKEEEHPHA